MTIDYWSFMIVYNGDSFLLRWNSFSIQPGLEGQLKH
jgi:hypothetical protein